MLRPETVQASQETTYLTTEPTCPSLNTWSKFPRAGAVVSGAASGITDKMEARPPAPSPNSTGSDPGYKQLGLVILTCLFLSLAELTEKEY